VAQRRRGLLEHLLAGIQDRPVAGAAAQVARQVVGDLLAGGGRLAVPRAAGRQRHHEARRAEAALRAVAGHHRLLRRMLPAEVFHRQQRMAVQRGQELDAAVDRLPGQIARLAAFLQAADQHGAGTAVAFVAAFLGAGAAGMLTQPAQHRGGGLQTADRDDGATVHEADGAGGGVGSLGHTRKIAARTGSGIRLIE
jgi:hypothetical protein